MPNGWVALNGWDPWATAGGPFLVRRTHGGRQAAHGMRCWAMGLAASAADIGGQWSKSGAQTRPTRTPGGAEAILAGFESGRDLHRRCVAKATPARWRRACCCVLAPGKRIRLWRTGTTNNRMEMMAVIEALSALKRPFTVTFFLDSEICAQGHYRVDSRLEGQGHGARVQTSL